MDKKEPWLSEDLISVDFELQLEMNSFPDLCARLRVACLHSLPHAFTATVDDFIEGFSRSTIFKG